MIQVAMIAIQIGVAAIQIGIMMILPEYILGLVVDGGRGGWGDPPRWGIKIYG